MSLGSRIVLGLVALLCAAIFLKTALNPSGLPKGPFIFYGLTAFCAVVAIACFVPRSHGITLRLIGAVIFCAFAAYAIDSLHTQNLSRAIVGFVFWGLPSGYVAIIGKYPSWGRGSAAFKTKQIR